MSSADKPGQATTVWLLDEPMGDALLGTGLGMATTARARRGTSRAVRVKVRWFDALPVAQPTKDPAHPIPGRPPAGRTGWGASERRATRWPEVWAPPSAPVIAGAALLCPEG